MVAGRLLICLIALCVLLCAHVAVADPGVLKMPVSSYAPWRIIHPDGRMEGIDIDVVRELCRRMSLKLELREAPFARSLLLLEQGQADVGGSLQRRPEREEIYHYIEPPYITGSDKVFYVLKRGGVTIQSYNDLHLLRIGVLPSTKYFPRFDNDVNLNKVSCRDYKQLYSLLSEGRIDTFIYSASVGDYLVQTNGHTEMVRHAQFKYPKKLQGYLVLSKESPLADRLSEFNGHLKEMIDDGVVDRIMQRYLGL